MKRAIRRHHSARMKAKARRVYRQVNGILDYLRDRTDKGWEDAAAKRADYMKCCSCYMCGNPRKYYKELTMQELRANLRDKDEF